ncbi:unnamed protein product [Amoebophrya sp. A120]|nr:unnamed protein product [Amoebophrya sp. A120]|eukprot:GSA120T00011411001.1
MSGGSGGGRSKKVNGKVIVAGAANTGKTCLIERFVRNVYIADDPSHGPTLGCDCLQKSVFVDDTEVYLFLYDTAGQERFADMAASYYRCGDVCLLVFDLANPASFDHIKWWQKKVWEYNPRCSFVLVGCKEDLIQEEGGNERFAVMSRWAESAGMPFFTTSAKKGGSAIQFLFYSVAEKCIRQAREKQLQQEEKNKEAGENSGHILSSFGPSQFEYDDFRESCSSRCYPAN